MNDDKISELIQKTVESELERVVFSNESQETILREIKNNSNRSMLSRFLNYKIRIPVNKFIIGVSVTAFVLVLLSYQTFRLTPENIKDSEIRYIQISSMK